MGWGTGFTGDIYINRVDVKDAKRANEMINECEGDIDDCINTLIGLAVATPARTGDESMTDLVNAIKLDVSEYIEIIMEQAVKKYQLQLYVEYAEGNGQ